MREGSAKAHTCVRAYALRKVAHTADDVYRKLDFMSWESWLARGLLFRDYLCILFRLAGVTVRRRRCAIPLTRDPCYARDAP